MQIYNNLCRWSGKLLSFLNLYAFIEHNRSSFLLVRLAWLLKRWIFCHVSRLKLIVVDYNRLLDDLGNLRHISILKKKSRDSFWFSGLIILFFCRSLWKYSINLQHFDLFCCSRYRRLSDQRLAEIETILALQNVKGVAVPVAFGKVDPAVV